MLAKPMFYMDSALSVGSSSRRFFGACLLLCLVGAGSATAGQHQPLDSLREAARVFLQAHHADAAYPVEIEIAALDDRLRLKRCGTGLAAEFAGRAREFGRTLLKVSCPAPAWQVYVPARVRGFVDALVATRALPRGSRIDADAVRIEKQAVSSLRDGFYTSIDSVVDLETQRSIRPGTVLTAQHLAAPRLIRRGESVMLVVRSGDFRIQTQGKALDDARRGRSLRVRNSTSGRVVEGRAIAPGVVEVAH